MTRRSWPLPLFMGAVWGFLEGTWFFVVPDVLLSYFAIGSLRRALAAAVGVALGAMSAACVLYWVLSTSPSNADLLVHEIWSALPGFRSSMITAASRYLESDGARGLVFGPQSGIPYRVFVFAAYRLGISLAQILLWTPAARFERILLAPLVVAAARVLVCRAERVLASTSSPLRCERLLIILVSIFWVVFYGWYWWFFLPRTYGIS